jgi:hypothetical protein
MSSLEAWKVHQVLSSMLDTFGVGEKADKFKPQGNAVLTLIVDSEQRFPGVEEVSPSNGEVFLPEGDIDWVSRRIHKEAVLYRFEGLAFRRHVTLRLPGILLLKEQTSRIRIKE